MLVKPPVRYRKPAPKERPRPAAAAGPLTLLAASFNGDDGAVVTLTFDRAVSIADVNPGAFTVTAHPLEGIYSGTSATLTGSAIVRLELSLDESTDPGDDYVLDATALTGIVAQSDGAAWAGVSDLNLPFP